MEVSRQLPSPAALLLRNSTLYPVTRKIDRTHILSYLFIYLFILEKSLFPLPIIEPRLIVRPTPGVVTIPSILALPISLT